MAQIASMHVTTSCLPMSLSKHCKEIYEKCSSLTLWSTDMSNVSVSLSDMYRTLTRPDTCQIHHVAYPLFYYCLPHWNARETSQTRASFIWTCPWTVFLESTLRCMPKLEARLLRLNWLKQGEEKKVHLRRILGLRARHSGHELYFESPWLDFKNPDLD